MIKILKTVAPTAEQLDFVIGNFFKENGMEYTSSMEYAPCIAGYGEFCEKRDLVYHLSEADEKKLRALTPYEHTPKELTILSIIDREITSHLYACVSISAPLYWYEHTLNLHRKDIITCVRSINSPILKEDGCDVLSFEHLHNLNVLFDAAVDTGSTGIASDFLRSLPDSFRITRSGVISYASLASLYNSIAYPSISDNDSDELKQESKWIMAKWIRDLPCSFLINPRFKNNCLAPLSDDKD